MDTSDSPENSIGIIDGFVKKYYSEGGQISCGKNASIKLPHPFVFPPDHRVMIHNFVSETKEKCKMWQKA